MFTICDLFCEKAALGELLQSWEFEDPRSAEGEAERRIRSLTGSAQPENPDFIL